jgi:hypothetical protein
MIEMTSYGPQASSPEGATEYSLGREPRDFRFEPRETSVRKVMIP